MVFNCLQADNLASELFETARKAVREPGSVSVRGVRAGKTIVLNPEPLTEDRLRVICTGREEYTGSMGANNQPDDFNECNRLTMAGNVETKLMVIVGRRFVLKLEHTHGSSISHDCMFLGPELIDTGPIRIGGEQCLRSNALLLIEHSLFREYRERLRECEDDRTSSQKSQVFKKIKELERKYGRPVFGTQKSIRARLVGHCLGSFGPKVTIGILTILGEMLEKLRDTQYSLESISGSEKGKELYQSACQRWDKRCEVIDRFIHRLLELDWSSVDRTAAVEKLEGEEFSSYISSSYTAISLTQLMEAFPEEVGKHLLEVLRQINLTFKETPVMVAK